MLIKLENCPICEKTEWIDLEYMRDRDYWYRMDMREYDEPTGFKICKTCGFITYDYISDERLKTQYNQQRQFTQAGHVVTAMRKNIYHELFLKDIDFKDKKVLDFGCGIGLLLYHLREKRGAKNENLHGVELTHGLSDYGKYEYNLNLTTSLDESLTYDFISLYHTLEHLQYPRKFLEKAQRILNENGLLYISVPIWLDKMENDAGDEPVTFEESYHLNHVNVFTYQSFKNLIGSTGFEIIKEDKEYYAYTVLCKKSQKKDIVPEKADDIVKHLELQKECYELFKNKKFKECQEKYPRFAMCYIHESITGENMKKFETQKEVLERGLAAMPGDQRLLLQLARLYFQWDENDKLKQGFYSNNIKMAEKIFHDYLKMKAANDDVYFFLSVIESKYKHNYDKGAEYLRKSMEINPRRYAESIDVLGQIWKEKGIREHAKTR